jgi:hypothetical protein
MANSSRRLANTTGGQGNTCLAECVQNKILTTYGSQMNEGRGRSQPAADATGGCSTRLGGYRFRQTWPEVVQAGRDEEEPPEPTRQGKKEGEISAGSGGRGAVPGVVDVPRDRGEGVRDLPGGGSDSSEGEGHGQEPTDQQGRRWMCHPRRAAGRGFHLAGESPEVEPPARALRLLSLRLLFSLCPSQPGRWGDRSERLTRLVINCSFSLFYTVVKCKD